MKIAGSEIKTVLLRVIFFYLLPVPFFTGCGSKDNPDPPPPPPVRNPVFISATINKRSLVNTVYDVSLQPVIRVNFSEPLQPGTVAAAVSVADINGGQEQAAGLL